MKKISVLVVAVVVCLVSMVSVAKAASDVTGDVYIGMSNKYLFRGVDLSDNKWVSQFGADLSYKGFTLSYWSNLLTKRFAGSPTGFKAGDITETDITLNYNYSPIDLLSFNVGNTFYSLEALNDTNELYLKTTVNTLLSPTLSIYWDYDEASKAGLFYTFGVGHTFAVNKNLGLNLGALVSYNQENWSVSEDYSNWNNYELTTGLDYTITDKCKLSASYTYSNAISHKARVLGGAGLGINNESLYGLKVAYNF
jgi:opacity protein-like surface antigen